MQKESFHFRRFMARSMRSAGQSLMRNKLLTVATVFIIALMIFVFNLILSLRFASDSVIETVGDKLDVSVELNDGVESVAVDEFIQTMKANPKVKEVVYVPKTEALDRLGSKYPNVISFLDHNGLENPLPDTVRLVTTGIANNNEVIKLLEGTEFATIVNQAELKENLEQKQRNEKILAITTMINRVSFWLILIFALVAVMIILNSINIKIHNHEKEIQIMKLVGSKFSFIRAGYIWEGLFFALAALIISLALSRLIIAYLVYNLAGIVDNETLMAGFNAILLHFEDHFWFTLIWQFLAVLFVGFLSSYLAIELYLRKKHSF